MTTTNITDKQIRILRTEALAAGDYDQAALCDLALEGEIDADDYTTLSRKMDHAIRTMTADAARAECARVIAEAQSNAQA